MLFKMKFITISLSESLKIVCSVFFEQQNKVCLEIYCGSIYGLASNWLTIRTIGFWLYKRKHFIIYSFYHSNCFATIFLLYGSPKLNSTHNS